MPRMPRVRMAGMSRATQEALADANLDVQEAVDAYTQAVRDHGVGDPATRMPAEALARARQRQHEAREAHRKSQDL